MSERETMLDRGRFEEAMARHEYKWRGGAQLIRNQPLWNECLRGSKLSLARFLREEKIKYGDSGYGWTSRDAKDLSEALNFYD